MIIRHVSVGPIFPFPKYVFKKAKAKLIKRPTLHFFLHHTICRLMLNYTRIPYSAFLRMTERLGTPGEW